MKAEDVLRYLQDNPGFFEDFAEVLAQIYIPHPHGGRAIPIAERQILTLREKSKLLEAKLAELIEFGEENDAIGAKMHRLCLALLPAGDLHAMLQALYYNLREDFLVPHAVLRIWQPRPAPGTLSGTEFSEVSEEMRSFACAFDHPYCGGDAKPEMLAWFGDTAEQLRSLAVVPLHDAGKACTGMLVLASEDANRFYPEMGTLYLERLGEMVSAALDRYL